MFHVGMGDDPQKLISYTASKNIVVQAYSPLGNGKLIGDAGLATIGTQRCGTTALCVGLCPLPAPAHAPPTHSRPDLMATFCGAHTHTHTTGKAYNKSAAQVAMKWLVDKGVAVVTKADNSEYIAEDINMWGWNMTAADTKTLSVRKL